jgi:hypothetical protein
MTAISLIIDINQCFRLITHYKFAKGESITYTYVTHNK